jgi:hypothetical protein
MADRRLPAGKALPVREGLVLERPGVLVHMRREGDRLVPVAVINGGSSGRDLAAALSNAREQLADVADPITNLHVVVDRHAAAQIAAAQLKRERRAHRRCALYMWSGQR